MDNTNNKVSIFGIDKAGSYKADCYLKSFLNQTMKPESGKDSISQNQCGFNTKTYEKAQIFLMKHWKLFEERMKKKFIGL